MSTGDRSARAQAVLDEVTAAVRPLGLVVEDVAVTPAGKRRLVRVLLDHDLADLDDADTTSAVPPLSLDAVADATRVVGDALDASDVMGEQPYVLEVSSSGTDRPLTEPRHFRRNVGRLVEVRAGEQEVTGRLVAADADGFTVQPEQGEEQRFALPDVDRAKVQLEFNRSDADDEES